ncbi:MAG: DNA primase [Desulfobacterales bacterium]|nr:DNA primase [Desulfobacterales bacterium]
MTVAIPEDKISEIKNAADIVEIVSETVILRKTGKDFQGLCPFHTEKTPSFTVSPAKQIFYCFGCGAGGNVFNFLMKKEGLTFPEALSKLARRCGIELPSAQLSPTQKQRLNEREKLLTVNAMAMAFFNTNLKTAIGSSARVYLTKRGINEQTINQYKIGFAPEGWDHLARFLKSKTVPLQLGEKSGLLRAKQQQGRYYDNFRNRIIFPIFDMENRVIGFGGRVMDKALPKYLNSPETPVYNKRRSLYGMQAARSESRARECVFVVEGYFDLLALHQNGIQNSVATLGTALTPEHIQILKGFIGSTGHIILVFDSDDAGIKAAERSVEVFSKGFVDARIIVLPTGHDPDSFIMEKGRGAFLEKASHSLSIIPFLIESAIKRHGLSTEGKVRIVSNLKDALAAIEDGLTRSLHIRDLAERLGVDETAVREKITAAITEHTGRRTQNASPVDSKRAINTDAGGLNISGRNRIERNIIAMMLQFPDIIAEIRKRKLLDLFENTQLRHLGEIILDQITSSGEDKNVADIISAIGDDAHRNAAASLAIGNAPWDDVGCQKLMDQFETSCGRYDKNLIQRIRSAESAGDYELVTQLQRQLLEGKQPLNGRTH